MPREALLIIDMSNDFVHDEGGLTVGEPARHIVADIVAKADEYLKSGEIVAICMDAHEKNDSHFELWPPHNVKGTWGQQLYGELSEWYERNRDNPHLLYVAKPEYDAFFGTNLHERLQAFSVKRVCLTGVCTDICDFLTAYGAYARGYETIAYRKGMATFSAHHDVFLEQMHAVFKTEIV